MTPERWQRIEELFNAVAELSAAERLELLRQECNDDPSLADEVEALIANGRQADEAGFLREPVPSLKAVEGELLFDTDGVGDTPHSDRRLRQGQIRLPDVDGFELLEEIGRGGMGVVYKARQRVPNRLVAVKMLLGGAFASADQRRRLRDEAEAAGKLDHPGIVPVYAASEHHGVPYFAMALVDGPSLRDVLADGPLPPREAAEVVGKIADAIEHAHRNDIFHRDLKPANILIGADGQPRVTDFGIATGWDEDATRTATGRLLGTPGFMAPEQAADRATAANPRTDVYGLGAVLYACLTGRPPFAAPSLNETLRRMQDEEPLPPRQIDRAIDRDVQTICLKCLAKSPGDRYASAAALANDLRRYLHGEPIQARGPGLIYRTRKLAVKHRGLLSAVAAVLLVLVLGILGTTVGMLRAIEATRLAKQQLQESLLNTARAARWSGRPGRRYDSLQAVSEAAAIRPLSHERERELRNEAVAAMALRDIRVVKTWDTVAPDSFAVDRDFRRYALSDERGNVTVREMETDRELEHLKGHGFRCFAMRFSNDGHFLAGMYEARPRENSLIVWNLETDEEITALSIKLSCSAWQFSPDSRTMVIGDHERRLRLVRLPSGEPILTLPTDDESNLQPNDVPNDVAFDPAGQRLAVAYFTSSCVQVIDIASKSITNTLPHPGHVGCVAWSDDGFQLAAAVGTTIHLWAMPSGRERRVLRGHRKVVRGLAFSHRGDLLVSNALGDKTVLWDAMHGEKMLETSGTYVMQFSPDDRWLSGAHLEGNRAGMWQISQPDEYRTFCYDVTDDRYDDWSNTGTWNVALHPTGDLLASSSVDGARLWDIKKGQTRPVAMLPRPKTSAIVFAPDRWDLIHSGWSGVFSWRLNFAADTGEVEIPGMRQLMVHDENEPPSFDWIEVANPESDTAPRPDAKENVTQVPFFAGDRDVDPETYIGRYMAADSNGRLLAISNPVGHHADIFDATDRKFLRLTDASGIDFVTLSPHGRWAVTSTNNEEFTAPQKTCVWRVADGSLEKVLPTRDAFASFSPNGKRLVTGSSAEYQIWETGTWKRIYSIPRTGATVRGAAAFSADGRLLAIVHSNHEVWLVDSAGGDEIARLAAPNQETVTWLTFGADDTYLAAACQGCGIQLWDLERIGHRLQEIGLGWGTAGELLTKAK